MGVLASLVIVLCALGAPRAVRILAISIAAVVVVGVGVHASISAFITPRM
jgi:hypothetical protein